MVALVTLCNGQLILLAIHGWAFPVREVWRLAVGCAAMPLFYVLLAVCATFVSRGTAAGIVAPCAVMLLPAIAELFPRAVQEALVPVLPASAIHTLSGMAQAGSMEYAGAPAAFAVLVAWGALASALAVWCFRQGHIKLCWFACSVDDIVIKAMRGQKLRRELRINYPTIAPPDRSGGSLQMADTEARVSLWRVCARSFAPTISFPRGLASRLRPSPSGGVGRRRATGPPNHVRYAEMRQRGKCENSPHPPWIQSNDM